MKRKIEDISVDDGNAISNVESLIDALFEKKKKNVSISNEECLDVLQNLLIIKANERAVVIPSRADMIASEERANNYLRTLNEIRSHNNEIEDAIIREHSNRAAGSTDELCEALREARSLEAEQESLKVAKTEARASKKEMESRFAAVEAIIPHLNKELKSLSKHIHLKKDIEIFPNYELCAPLFVLHQSVQMHDGVLSEVVEYKGEKRIHPFVLNVYFNQKKEEPDLTFGYSGRLDVVVVSGKEQVLKSVCEEGDDGMQSPSIRTSYLTNINEKEELTSLKDMKPYKWAQMLCGIRCVRSVADYANKPFTINHLLNRVATF